MGKISAPKTTDLQLAYTGLQYLLTGEELPLPNRSDTALQGLITGLSSTISNPNTRAPVKPKADAQQIFNNPKFLNVSAEDQGSIRDRLKTIAADVQAGKTVSYEDALALESAMYAGNHEVELDGFFTPEELPELTEFQTDYLNTDIQLGAQKESNLAEDIAAEQAAAEAAAAEAARKEAEAKAAAEAAEQAERDRVAAAEAQEYRDVRFDATLVYAGYLDPAKAGDLGSRQQAMYDFLLDNQFDVIDGTHDLASRMREYFGEDGTAPISQDAIDLLKEQVGESNMSPALVEAHLMSGDRNLISLAQHYMSGQGYTIAKEEYGYIGQTTLDAGTALLREDISIPASVYYEDGSINMGQIGLLAHRGQLAVPALDDPNIAQYLTADEITTAKELQATPDEYISWQEYVAQRMFDEHDGSAPTYGKFITDYNAGNGDAVLEAKLEELPRYAIPAEAKVDLPLIDLNSPTGAAIIPVSLGDAAADGTLTQLEVQAATSNLVGVTVADPNILGGSSYLSDVVHNKAEGVLADGTLVFAQSQRDLITDVYADAFIQNAQQDDGTPGMMTMADAIRWGASLPMTERDMFLDGASPGGGDGPTEMGQTAARIQEILLAEAGRDPDYLFDPNKPEDMRILLQGTFIYMNREPLSQMGDGTYMQNYLTAALSDPAVKEMQASIDRVAIGRPSVDGTQYAAAPVNACPDLTNSFCAATTTADATAPVAPAVTGVDPALKAAGLGLGGT